MTIQRKTPVVIFDFGGVFVDWSPYYLYRKVMKNDSEIQSFLEEIDFHNWNNQFDKGYPFEKGIEEKCAEFPQYAELIRRFNSHWMDAMGQIFSGTVEIARQFKDAGYTLYGLSNWSTTKFNLVKDRCVFLQYLDDFILSGQVNQIKPAPDIFHTLLNRFNLQAADCLFIDDSAANIQTANQLGFQTIRFESPEQLASALSGNGIKLHSLVE